jgi:phosphoribosylpyrophosphate synthetase
VPTPQDAYSESELSDCLSDGWRGDDFAIFRYKRARFANAATHLVLDFKDNKVAARTEVLSWCTGTVGALEDELRTTRAVAYVVALPRSGANAPNAPCEWVAAQLQSEFSWLTHLPGALVRTTSTAPSHKSAIRPTVAEHLQTISYAGPPLRPPAPINELYCAACQKQYHTPGGLAWHVTNNSYHARAAERAGGAEAKSVLMIDDVITRGATSQACRELLVAAGAKNAVGFFVARTG